MIWFPVIGFLAGFFTVWFKDVTVPSEFASYLSLATIAGIDTILGGIRSGLEGRFQSDIFLSGFLVNTVMAALLAYFGDQIGVPDLYLAAVVVLGWRIFLNLSLIRRHVLGRSYLRHHQTVHQADAPLSHAVPPATPVETLETRNAPSVITPVEAP